MAGIDAEEMIDALKLRVNEEWLGSNQRIARFLTFVNRFHNYSAFNRLMILAQKPDATLVGGFKTWQSVGRRPEKGTGLKVFRPYMKRFPKRDDHGNTLKDADGEDIMVTYVSGYGVAASTFDVSDTEGDDLPRASAASVEDPEATAEFLQAMVTLAERTPELTFERRDVLETKIKGDLIFLRSDLNDLEAGLEMAYVLALRSLDLLPGAQDKLIPVEQRWVARASTFTTAARFGFDMMEYTAENLQERPQSDVDLDRLLTWAAKLSDTMAAQEAGAPQSWLASWSGL